MQIKCSLRVGKKCVIFSSYFFFLSLWPVALNQTALLFWMLFPSSFLFFSPLSRFIQHSPPPLICERQKRSLQCTPRVSRVSRVQREWGSIHVMRQTVRRVCSVTLTPSPWHDLCWLTSCSPSSGFKKTAEDVCEHVYDPCHFWHVSNWLPETFMCVSSAIRCCQEQPLLVSAVHLWWLHLYTEKQCHEHPYSAIKNDYPS